MNVNKETLIKNRFWILLPIAVILLFVALFSIMSLNSAAEENWKTAVDKNNALASIPGKDDLRNDAWIAEMKKRTEEAKRQKEDLLFKIFDLQNGVVRAPERVRPTPANADGTTMAVAAPPRRRPPILAIRNPLITWPNAPELAAYSKKDFGEYLGNVPNEYKEVYIKQYDAIVRSMPVLDELRGTGYLRILGWAPPRNLSLSWETAPHILRPDGWNGFGDKYVLYEEAWLLQEDLGIRRELVKVVQEANSALGVLQPEWREATLPDSLRPPDLPPLPPEATAEGGTEAGTTPTPPPPPPSPDVQLKQAPPAAAGTPAAAGAPPPEGEAKKEPEPEVIDRKRLYNFNWAIPLAAGMEEANLGSLPNSRWWEGWFLELELVPDGKNVVLKGKSENLSTAIKIPPMPLWVYLSDGVNEIPTPVRIDAGGLDVKNPKADSKADSSTKVINPTPVPASIKRITRVQAVPSAPARDHQRFFNASWLVDVRLVPGPGGAGWVVEGKVYNRSGRRLLPVNFEIVMAAGQGREEIRQEVSLKSDPVNAFASRDFRQVVNRPFPPVKIVGVRQVLDWRTVPVKRIDQIRVGAVAHLESDRTKVVRLKTYDFKRKDIRPGTATAAAPAATTGVPGAPGAPGFSAGSPDGGGGAPLPGQPGVMGSGGGFSGGMGSQAAGAVTANHAVPMSRYYETTEEVRRVPVALVLVVEMGHMNDVLTALANSRLRVQVTQAVWTRMPLPLGRPNFAQAVPAAPGAPPAGGRPPLLGGGGSSAARGGAAMALEEESNQIELQVFGLAAIYENPDEWRRIQEEKNKTSGAITATGTTPSTGTTP